MPKTIEDAMQMCIGLGERYLWVDRLCIVQDDPQEKQVQIEGMAAVFAKAAFTIISACGEGMEVSLPGVIDAADFTTAADQFDKLHVRTCSPFFDETVAQSAWTTRGWTYQEDLLSHKKLYVSSAQLFWVCSAGMISEDLVPSWNETDYTNRDEPSRSKAPERLEVHGDYYGSYASLAAQYNQRSLTHISDIYAAFTGIISALYSNSNSGRASLYNVPLKDFDAALLWRSSDEQSVARSGDKTMYIPSWSWSSVTGDFTIKPSLGSVVKWFTVSRDSEGNLAQIESVDPVDSIYLNTNTPSATKISYWTDRQFLRTETAYFVRAFLYGCIELFIDCDWLYFPKRGFTNTLRTLLPPLAPGNLNRTLLVTRAQTTTVKLVARSHSHPSGGRRAMRTCSLVLGVNDEPLGFYDPWSVLPGNEPSENTTFKVMAISVGRSEVSKCCFPRLNEPEDQDDPDELYEEEARPLYPSVQDLVFSAPVLNIMVLGQKDGIYCRYGIGQVYLRCWARQERRYETIVLC